MTMVLANHPRPRKRAFLYEGKMRISEDGIELIKKHEGLAKLRDDGKVEAYPDAGYGWDVPTIGYGTTRGVTKGMVITKDEAERLLIRDLGGIENTLERLVKVPLNQNQVNALASFIYNVGAGAFENSTLLAKLNAGHHDAVPAQLARWKHSNGKVFKGLVRRRADEATLWDAPVSDTQKEPTPERTPKYAEPEKPRKVKDIAKEDGGIQAILMAVAGAIAAGFQYVMEWLTVGGGMIRDVNQTLGPWDSLLNVLGANGVALALGVTVVAGIAAAAKLIRDKQEGA